MLRPTLLRNATLCALVGASLLGCPGHIDDPSAFLGPTGDASIVTCTLGVGNVESQIIRGRCATAGCHERATRAGDLDLETTPLAARLVNAPSPHCSGRVLVSSSAPASSYLLEKLGASPRCGARMPLDTPPLSPAEVVCVRAWIDTLLTDGGTRMDVVDVTVADVRDVVDVSNDQRDAADATSDAMDAGMDVVVDAPADARDASGDVGDASLDAGDAPADVGDASGDAGDASADVGDASGDAGDASSSVGDASGDAGDASSSVGDASGDAGDASSSVGDASGDVSGDAGDA